MTTIPSINELWKNEECPLVDGVIFNDGTVIEFSTTNSLSGGLIFDVKRKTDLKEILQNNPDNYKCLYHSALEKIHESNRYTAGEGSWGGDGYIACLDLKTNDVLWIFTSDKINPIIDLDFSNGKIIAKNNNNSVFSIEVKYLDKKVIISEEIENDTTTVAKKS
jgi:hypothetical protein